MYLNRPETQGNPNIQLNGYLIKSNLNINLDIKLNFILIFIEADTQLNLFRYLLG